MEFIFGLTALNTKANGSGTRCRAKESLLGQMAENLLGNSRPELCMVTVFILGKMGDVTKEVIIITKSMDMAFISTVTEVDMMVNG